MATTSTTSLLLRLLQQLSTQQLQLLAAAFKLCPEPSAQQLAAIADRVSLPADRLQQWFDSRKVLQEWIQAQPSIIAEDIMDMFYQQC